MLITHSAFSILHEIFPGVTALKTTLLT